MLLPLGPWGLDSAGTAVFRFLRATPVTDRRIVSTETDATRRKARRADARTTGRITKS